MITWRTWSYRRFSRTQLFGTRNTRCFGWKWKVSKIFSFSRFANFVLKNVRLGGKDRCKRHSPRVTAGKIVIEFNGSQTFLSATQIWVWWTPRDPGVKQRKKVMIVWMIFASKLLRSFSVSAIYPFLLYLRYRQTSSGNVKYTSQDWIASARPVAVLRGGLGGPCPPNFWLASCLAPQSCA